MYLSKGQPPDKKCPNSAYLRLAAWWSQPCPR